MNIDSSVNNSTSSTLWSKDCHTVISSVLPHLSDQSSRAALMWVCKDFLQLTLDANRHPLQFHSLPDVPIQCSINRLSEWSPAVSAVHLTSTEKDILVKSLRAFTDNQRLGRLPALETVSFDAFSSDIVQAVVAALEESKTLNLDFIASCPVNDPQGPVIRVKLNTSRATPDTPCDSTLSPAFIPIPTAAVRATAVQLVVDHTKLDISTLKTLLAPRLKKYLTGSAGNVLTDYLNHLIAQQACRTRRNQATDASLAVMKLSSGLLRSQMTFL